MTKSKINQLAETFRGILLHPESPDYNEARAVWNGMIDRKPALVARCKGVADIKSTLEFARKQDLALSIRGGGHHVAGHAVCEGGVMMDLSAMDNIRVDPEAKVAQVGPGARVRDLDHETQAFGLATTGAPVSMVGVAGYTLGGGLGWTSRLHGLACDNLISADIITADGEFVHANEDENTDMFWAIRGGGGNFGIVTSFEFRLHELGPQVLAGPIIHPMNSVPKLLRFWRDYMNEAPDELQCMPVIFQVPDGETVFCLYPLYAGDPAVGEKIVVPFREIGNPITDDISVVSYAGLLSDLDEMYKAGHRNYYRSAFFDTLPDEAIDAFAEKASSVPTPFSSIFLEPMGGAIARKDPHATAFPHRERSFCITAVPKWKNEDQDSKMKAWANSIFEALAPYAAEGIYVNYLADEDKKKKHSAYGQHWKRLRKIKKKWDPENVFRVNHNIPPAD